MVRRPALSADTSTLDGTAEPPFNTGKVGPSLICGLCPSIDSLGVLEKKVPGFLGRRDVHCLQFACLSGAAFSELSWRRDKSCGNNEEVE